MKKIFTFLMAALFSATMLAEVKVAGTLAVNGWDGDVMTDGTYTSQTLTAGEEYKFKVVDGGAWKGFENLDASTVVSGIYGEGSGDANILFKLKEAGTVTITYNEGKIAVTGNFVEQTVAIRGYVSWNEGDDLNFTIDPNNKLTATYELVVSGLTEVTYPKFKVLLNGGWYSDAQQLNRERPASDALTGNESGDMSLKQDVNATYVLTYTYATRTLAVTPFPDLPAMKYYVYGNFAEGDIWVDQEMTETDGVWSAKFTPSYERDQYQFLIKRVHGLYQPAYYGAQDADNNMTEGNSSNWSLTYTNGQNIKMTPNDKSGDYTFIFVPNKEDEGIGTLSVAYPSGGTAIDNTEAGNAAVKRLVNGQLVIVKGDKTFNALGAEVK